MQALTYVQSARMHARMHVCYLIKLYVNLVEFICKLSLLLGVNSLRQDLLGLAFKKLQRTLTSKLG